MKKIILSFLFTSSLWATDIALIKDCPESSNCVSTKATKDTHYIEPILFNKTSEDFKNFVEQIIVKFPRTTLVRSDKNYAHIEFTSLIFRFTDDVELFFDQAESKIHLRSASRIGHSDMGANKKRVLKIKEIVL